jgi:hypothetical protein
MSLSRSVTICDSFKIEEIRELLRLKGGEYFVMKAKPEKRKIELKVAKFVEEGQL